MQDQADFSSSQDGLIGWQQHRMRLEWRNVWVGTAVILQHDVQKAWNNWTARSARDLNAKKPQTPRTQQFKGRNELQSTWMLLHAYLLAMALHNPRAEPTVGMVSPPSPDERKKEDIPHMEYSLHKGEVPCSPPPSQTEPHLENKS